MAMSYVRRTPPRTGEEKAKYDAMRAKQSERATARWAKFRHDRSLEKKKRKLSLPAVREWYGARGIMIARDRDGQDLGGWGVWRAVVATNPELTLAAGDCDDLIAAIRDAWGIDGTVQFGTPEPSPFAGLGL